jgi:hypothetical protein
MVLSLLDFLMYSSYIINIIDNRGNLLVIDTVPRVRVYFVYCLVSLICNPKKKVHSLKISLYDLDFLDFLDFYNLNF